jgi:hypothetical protein
MGARKIENSFLNNQGDCVQTYEVPTPKKSELAITNWQAI